MKPKSCTIIMIIAALLLPVWIFAQTVISGRVTETGTNIPLQGATVSVRGTTNITQTDADGRFSITVSGSNPKLLISYVGYVSQMVDATDNARITLSVDNTKMSEVVVTGLASSLKRSNLANAVASISSKDLVGTTVQ